MKNESFDWDRYFSNSTWDEIRKKSPLLSSQRLPSLINHEQRLVYLPSVDLDFSLSDAAALENILVEVKDAFYRAKKSKSYYKMAVANSDFIEIKNLLANLGIENFDSIED